MIPVIAPPLDEPSARTKWLRADADTDDVAPPERAPRRPPATVLIGLGAAAFLVAAMFGRKYARDPHRPVEVNHQ